MIFLWDISTEKGGILLKSTEKWLTVYTQWKGQGWLQLGETPLLTAEVHLLTLICHTISLRSAVLWTLKAASVERFLCSINASLGSGEVSKDKQLLFSIFITLLEMSFLLSQIQFWVHSLGKGRTEVRGSNWPPRAAVLQSAHQVHEALVLPLSTYKQVMVAKVYIPNSQEVEAEDQKFRVILSYTVSWRSTLPIRIFSNNKAKTKQIAPNVLEF